MEFRKRFVLVDLFICISLVVFTLAFADYKFDFPTIPFEDAAILMRYAEHFAQGHGIVWNIGDKPVDGATDFLFVILSGLLIKSGYPLEFSTRILGLITHITSVVIIYIVLRKLHQAPIILCLIPALYLAVGPGLYYIAAYFGTPFFGLLSLITWAFVLILLTRGLSHPVAALYATSALIMGLIRPEGVILAGLMLLSILWVKGFKKSRIVVLYFLGVFVLFGGLYFLWRWDYFGYPLPNPFYKKSGGILYPGSLKDSIIRSIKLCLPFIPAFILGFRSSKTMQLTIGFLIPVLGFTFSFILISNEMNFGSRFQYAILPIVLTSWYPLVKDIQKDFDLPKLSLLDWQKRLTLSALFATYCLWTIDYQLSTGFAVYQRDGRYDVAILLQNYQDEGYKLATSETGLLPLYSRWRTLDTWGLNDPWIAHNGKITEAYLDQFKPEIIVFHAYFSPLADSNRPSDDWTEMVLVLKNYAESRGFFLAAAYGISPYDTHYYYVQTDFPHSEEIICKIQKMDYVTSNVKTLNYAALDK
jgi:hypothetical protein